jgi:hypothetical protein
MQGTCLGPSAIHSSSSSVRQCPSQKTLLALWNKHEVICDVHVPFFHAPIDRDTVIPRYRGYYQSQIEECHWLPNAIADAFREGHEQLLHLRSAPDAFTIEPASRVPRVGVSEVFFVVLGRVNVDRDGSLDESMLEQVTETPPKT